MTHIKGTAQYLSPKFKNRGIFMTPTMTAPAVQTAIAAKLSDDLLSSNNRVDGKLLLDSNNPDRQVYADIHYKLKHNKALTAEEMKNLQALHDKYTTPTKDTKKIAVDARKENAPKNTVEAPKKESPSQTINVEKKTFTRRDENGNVVQVNVDTLRAIPAAKDAFADYDKTIDRLNNEADAAFNAANESRDKLEKSTAVKSELEWGSKSFRKSFENSKKANSLSQQEVKDSVDFLVTNPTSKLTLEQKNKLIQASVAVEKPEDAKLSPQDKEKVLANRAAIAVVTAFNDLIKAENENFSTLEADAIAKLKAHNEINGKLNSEVEKAAVKLRADLDLAAKNDKTGELSEALNAWDRGDKIKEFTYSGIRADKVSALSGMNQLIDKQIQALKAAGKLPKAIEDAYNNGTIIDDKTLKSKEMAPFKGLIGLINLRNEGAIEAYSEFSDGLATHVRDLAAAKAKDGRMTLPSKVGEIGFSWNEKGEPTRFFFGDNKAYHGGPEMLRLVGFVLQNGGVTINGAKYSDEALMKAAGVSKETIKEFFAGFPGSSGLVNKVKSGQATVDEIMLGVSTNMENQMDVAQRVISGRGMKRDEARHILMKVASLEGVGVAGLTLATGGTASAAGFNVLLNALPMSGDLKTLLGLGAMASGIFDRRSKGIKIGNGSGNGNGNGGQGSAGGGGTGVQG